MQTGGVDGDDGRVGPDGDALERARLQGQAELRKDRPARATRTLTWMLEDLVPIPGTRFRFGLDPVLSVVPWAGAVVGSVFGAALLVDALRLRMPLPVLARMLGNWGLDALLGMIPYAGPLFDLAWRSNRKNLALLNRTIDNREQVREASVLYWIVAVTSVVGVITLAVLTPLLLLAWLASLG